MAQKRDLWYSNLLLATSNMGRFGFRLTLAMGTTFRVPLAMGFRFKGNKIAIPLLAPSSEFEFPALAYISASSAESPKTLAKLISPGFSG